MRILGRRAVLDRELADRLSKAVGFRNILVHEYIDVDNSLVLAHLEELGDLEAFVAQVSAWLTDTAEAE